MKLPKKALAISLKKLGLDYIDLYLMHQPYGDVQGAWRAMEEAKAEGKVRSIGVWNMSPKIYQENVPHFATKPSVNQIQFNPFNQQKPIREFMAKDGVHLEAWGPLGEGNKDLLTNPVITKLAKKYGKNTGQVILRFELQEGAIIFPRSVKPARIKSNMEIFDFALTEEEMDEIRALDTGKGYDPDAPGLAERLISAYDIHAND